MHKSIIQTLFFSTQVMSLLLMLFSTALIADVKKADFTATAKPNDIELFLQAVKHSKQSQWLLAEPIYRELIKRNQEWPEPANNLAILLLKTNRLDEAKALLEAAVVSSPSYQVAQQNRTQLYNYLATQAYAKALGKQPHTNLPQLQLIDEINQPVKVIEIEVEKIVIQKEFVEVPVVQNEPTDMKIQNQSNLNENTSNRIKQQLIAWSEAWSQGDFDFYIQIYSKAFQPSDARKSYQQWKDIRYAKLKFTKDVSVKLEQLRVFIEPSANYALVEFVQNYHSKTYNDKVLKQVYMERQDNNWLILSERIIKIY